jgi:hypothetical protein
MTQRELKAAILQLNQLQNDCCSFFYRRLNKSVINLKKQFIYLEYSNVFAFFIDQVVIQTEQKHEGEVQSWGAE